MNEIFRTTIIQISIWVAVAGVILALIRGLIGPTPADRVVAIDSMTTVATVIIALFAHLFKRFIYLDVALVFGLLAFITVLIIARCLERRMI